MGLGGEGMGMFRKLMIVLTAAAGAAPALATDLASPRALEQRVLDEINRIRAAPRDYVGELRTFREWFDGTLLHVPGMHVGIRTTEGASAVDEAIGYAEQQPGAEPLAFSPLLAAAAGDHATYLSGGADGHTGPDGSHPWDRVKRRGGGYNVAEIISFGFDDPREVARQFLVDDGVPDRGHRTAMFDPRYRYAGVSCGPHPRFMALCVVELSPTPDGN